jgi:ribosomal protein S18 acetylase RimI-like enzyme
MRTRPIRADELDLFVEVSGAPEHRRKEQWYIESMFAAGSMRPEWCFVAQEEEGDRPLGRVALWRLPGMKEPSAVLLLDVSPYGDYAAVGTRLLRDVLEEARGLGAEEIAYVLDLPPIGTRLQLPPEERADLLVSVGFHLRRETDRFEWRGGAPPDEPGRLSFRTLEEVGGEAFVEAMERVSEGTLDREIRAERERLGPQRAARGFFEDARRVGHDPSWWRLAYDAPGGELVGLVMPAEPPELLTIFYVGVVPETRGRGYVDDLLACGTATLLAARRKAGSEKPLRADTDVANAPMAAAFERAGWARFAGRREYVVKLASDR